MYVFQSGKLTTSRTSSCPVFQVIASSVQVSGCMIETIQASICNRVVEFLSCYIVNGAVDLQMTVVASKHLKLKVLLFFNPILPCACSVNPLQVCTCIKTSFEFYYYLLSLFIYYYYLFLLFIIIQLADIFCTWKPYTEL